MQAVLLLIATASASDQQSCQFGSDYKYEEIKMFIVDWYKLHADLPNPLFCKNNTICSYKYTPLVMRYTTTTDTSFQTAKEKIVSLCGTYDNGVCCRGKCSPNVMTGTQVCDQNIERVGHLRSFVIVVFVIVLMVVVEFSQPTPSDLLPLYQRVQTKKPAALRPLIKKPRAVLSKSFR